MSDFTNFQIFKIVQVLIAYMKFEIDSISNFSEADNKGIILPWQERINRIPN